ncbi:MAG: transglycosylase SLT domain-containing protein [Desulfobacteraceae bacterium]|nr:transglycosylase SLT domain-containing protein [Desulfobacteraceae bacterium]
MSMEKKCRIGILVLLSFSWIGFCGIWSWGSVEPAAGPQFVVPHFQIPDRAELCGEPVPIQAADVRERFDREFTIITHSHAQVYLWLKRSERFFPWIEKQLASRGLPDDLKYVAVAESDLMNNAVSQAGAAGPWQFMPATAGNYGMCQAGGVDERYDFEISASGAFKYLKNLQGSLQNWTLAIAAYNCGERRVQDEMKRQKAQSFYLLKLPQETERYIFRILSIKEVLRNPAKYGYYLPKGAGYRVILTEKVSVNLPGPITISTAAEAAGITYREFKLLNPCLISDTIPKGSITLKVPEGKGKEFERKIDAWKASYKPSYLFHRVAKGESLDLIARKYKKSEQEICAWNKIKSSKVRSGQMLKIYQ